MLETFVLLNIFWDLWYFFQNSSINKKLKRTVFIQNRNFVLQYTLLFKSLWSVIIFFFLKKLILLFSKDVVRVLLCVSRVPASCVHIWFVSCPCFMPLWVKYVPAVFVSLSVINLCILVHACWVWFRLVYSLFPGVSVHVSPALMSTLKTIIWVYVLVCVFLFLPRVCTVTDVLNG